MQELSLLECIAFSLCDSESNPRQENLERDNCGQKAGQV
jgi:hypothetical protein